MNLRSMLAVAGLVAFAAGLAVWAIGAVGDRDSTSTLLHPATGNATADGSPDAMGVLPDAPSGYRVVGVPHRENSDAVAVDVIEGYVARDFPGGPRIVGGTVHLVDMSGEMPDEEEGWVASTLTDDSGMFSIEAPQGGAELFLRVEERGFHGVVSAVSTTHENVLVLRSRSHANLIMGRVIDAQSRPVQDFTIQLMDNVRGDALSERIKAESPDGHFSADIRLERDVADAVLVVRAQGFIVGRVELEVPVGVDVGVGDVVLYDVLNGVSGRVVDAVDASGIGGAVVIPWTQVTHATLGLRMTNEEEPVATDSSGAFRVSALTQDTLTLLLVTAPGYCQRAIRVRDFPAAPNGTIVVAMSKGITLSGAVRGPNSNEQGLRFGYLWEDIAWDDLNHLPPRFSREFTIDQDGTFRLQSVGPGNYQIGVLEGWKSGGRSRGICHIQSLQVMEEQAEASVVIDASSGAPVTASIAIGRQFKGSGVWVEVRGPGGQLEAIGRINPREGECMIPGLSTGTHSMQIIPGFRFNPFTLQFTSNRSGAAIGSIEMEEWYSELQKELAKGHGG